MSKENALELLIKSAEAAIAYDRAIQGCANDPDKMSSYCTAQGDDLDTLYFNWIQAARSALIAAKVSPAAANKATEEGELPALPLSKSEYGFDHTLSFCAADMYEYARRAIAADRASRQVANKAAEEGELLVEAKELSEKLRRHHADDLWDWDDLLYAADMIDKFATDCGSRHIANSGKVKPFGYFHELLNVDGSGKGIWLGCDSEQDTKNSHIDGETGGAVIALYAPPPATTGASTAHYEMEFTAELDRLLSAWSDAAENGVTSHELIREKIVAHVKSSKPVGASTVLTDERIAAIWHETACAEGEGTREHPAVFARAIEREVEAQAGQNCFLSWGGKNVHGDEASIKAVKAALHDAGTVPELKDRIRDLQAQAGQVAVPDDLARDAARFRWLEERFTGFDFYWMGTPPYEAEEDKGKCVIVFECGQDFEAGRHFQREIDKKIGLAAAPSPAKESK